MLRTTIKLGILSSLSFLPLATIACKTEKAKDNQNISQETTSPKNVQIPTTHDILNHNESGLNNITIDVRIPDWDHKVNFNATTYDEKSYIEEWDAKRDRTTHQMVLTHKMIPFKTDRHFIIGHTEVKNLGDLLDEINQNNHDDIFKFNMDKDQAGSMGRFLMGIKKSDELLKSLSASELKLSSYWGMHFEDNGHGDIIQNDDEFYSYISLSSTTSKVAVHDSHNNFIFNESSHAFDHYLEKGVDGIGLASNDIFDLNLWRMI